MTTHDQKHPPSWFSKAADLVPDRLQGTVDQIRRQKRQLLRISLQTAAATLATYLLIAGIAPLNLSWAIISALLTIGLSADLSYRNAINRTAGACLGAVLGLIFGVLIGGSAIYALLVAVILANMFATVWPSLQYGAVTAAIVALEPDPEVAAALSRTTAIVAGTVVGAVASFVIWPVRGRDRAKLAMRDALTDCQDLLELIDEGVSTDDHRERDKVNRRFLQHLEIAKSRVSETRFAPELKSGAELRDAVRGVESLWHALVILDRAVTDERQDISHPALSSLAPAIDKVQGSARDHLAGIIAAMKDDRENAPAPDQLCETIAHARDHAAELADEGAEDWPRQARALHAVIFGLNETERQLLRLGKTVGS
jgi:uncharacterized membrane protein YccC